MLSLHIPSHLKKFEIINILQNLIVGYIEAKNKGEFAEEENSLKDYFYNKSLDSVKKFLMLCISENNFSSSDQYESIIKYYSNKFLSFRGTLKIFDIINELKSLLGMSFNFNEGDLDYEYNISLLSINLDSVETTDMQLFTESIKSFFETLLYFDELEINIDTVYYNFELKTSTNLFLGLSIYSEFKIEENENDI